MRSFVLLVFSLCVVGEVYANRAVGDKKFSILREMVADMVRLPKYVEKMKWEGGGVTVTEFIKYLRDNDANYGGNFSKLGHTTEGERLQVRRAVLAELDGDAFQMITEKKTDTGRKVFDIKYFTGTLNLREVISEVIADPEIADLMGKRGNGATLEDIVAGIEKLRPDVYALYENVSDGEIMQRLGGVVRMKMHDEMRYKITAVPMEESNGSLKPRFFLND